jgi:RNA polymerase sigma factor (sigma-70 family)
LTFNEIDIAKRCAANERQAQEQLYRRFFQPMLQMCLRYTDGNRDRALEILNDGFLRVFKKIHLYEGRGSLEGWIRKLIFHAVSDYYKANDSYLKKVVFDELPIENQPKIVAKPENTEGALAALFFEDLLVLVDFLPPATREVFKLYAVEGFSHAEIGEQLGITTGTSKWHLSEARNKLKILLEKRAYSR